MSGACFADGQLAREFALAGHAVLTLVPESIASGIGPVCEEKAA